MALTASPPPSDLSPQHQELSDQLDEDIARVRAEIESLTQRKTLLVSSLLSSTRVQTKLTSHEIESSGSPRPSDERTPLQVHSQHNQTNVHRLAYGVTSFPFTDPNPDAPDQPLLGIRFDILNRTGKFEKVPYYLFLRRVNKSRQQENEYSIPENTGGGNDDHDLSIHHHTIPALVPLQEYETRYLPRPVGSTLRTRDEGYFSPSANGDDNSDNDDDNMREHSSTAHHNSNATRLTQDLHGLVSAIRHDLVSWQLRHDAISLLSEQLGLSGTSAGQSNIKPAGSFLVQSIESTAVDARFCRLVWQNGTVGRLRLTDDGYVDRAVVVGDAGDDSQPSRLRNLERILCTAKDGDRLKVSNLVQRLQVVARKLQEKAPKVTNSGTRERQDETM